MKNTSIGMAIVLFLCIIVSTIIPSHIARDLVESLCLKNEAKHIFGKRKSKFLGENGLVFHIYNPPFCESHQCVMKHLG